MMATSYEVHAGARSVAKLNAATPQEALVEYARSLGYSDEEILRVAPDAISWRGSVLKAVPASTGREADPDATQVIPPEELPHPPDQPQDPAEPSERPWRDPEPSPWNEPETPPAREPEPPRQPPEHPQSDR
jgi:hypothetical protein